MIALLRCIAVALMLTPAICTAQDYATAHMWLNIAAANGDKDAGKARDGVAAEMTAAAIIEAQRRARACMESRYRAYRACD